MEVGGYSLSGVLGSGGFATVYRGTDPADGSAVAVKVLDRVDSAFQARAQAEADAMRLVDHPNCVRVRAVLVQPPAIVTDFVEGASLRVVLDRYGRLTGPQALDVLTGALRGLIAVHQAGLLHGDVKPDNILVDRSGVSRLIDFGLAAAPPTVATRKRRLTGSPGYLSPEQIRGGLADVRSDIYACAVMLFELLCGERPYAGDTLAAVLDQHVSAPVPDPRLLDPSISPAFAQLCMNGMAKDPVQRPQTAAEFLAALEEAAHERYGAAWRSGAGIGALVGGLAAGAALGTTATAGSGFSVARGIRLGARISRRAIFVTGASAAVVAAAVVVTVAVAGGSSSGRTSALPGHLLIRVAQGVELIDSTGRPGPQLPPRTSPVCCSVMAVSPDGTRVLVRGEGYFGAQRLGSTSSTQLWSSPAIDVGSAAWSPDGKQVAFSTLDPSTPVPSSDVEVVSADGSGQRVVAHGLNVGSIAWSPDGRRIAYTQNQGGIWVVSIGGGQSVNVLTGPQGANMLPGSVSWSRSNRLIFNEVGIAPSGVWTMAPDGSDLHLLLASASSPSWAPDGNHFAAILHGRVDVADNAGRVEQTIGPAGVQSVQWSG